MTRKDYVAIAEALRLALAEVEIQRKAIDEQYRKDTRDPAETQRDGVLDAAYLISDAMRRDNPRFDREHFLAVVRGERELTSRPPRRAA